MRQLWLLVGALATSPIARADAQSHPGAPPPLQKPAPPSMATAPEVAKRCVYPVLPPPPVDPPSGSGTCANHRADEARVRATLRARFTRTIPRSRVEVAFDCDPLTAQPTELLIETGSGHGGAFAVWHLTRPSGQAPQFAAVGFVHTMPWATYNEYTYEVANRFSAKVVRGTVPAAALLAALATARPALTATISEVAPPPPPNGANEMSSFSSSGDYHVRVRIGDGSHLLERHYTGYPGSGYQQQYLGVQLAAEVLQPLLQRVGAAESPTCTAAESVTFARGFLSALPSLYPRSAWWVRPRYVRLAGWFGSTALMPALLEDLRRGLSELANVPAPQAQADANDPAARLRHQRSAAQSRLSDTINAIVRLTGFDPRRSGDGLVRPVDEVAQEIVAACTP